MSWYDLAFTIEQASSGSLSVAELRAAGLSGPAEALGSDYVEMVTLADRLGDLLPDWVINNWDALELWYIHQRQSGSKYDVLSVMPNLTECQSAARAVAEVDRFRAQKADSWFGDLIESVIWGSIGTWLAGPASPLGWGRWILGGTSAVAVTVDLVSALTDEDWDLAPGVWDFAAGATVGFAQSIVDVVDTIDRMLFKPADYWDWSGGPLLWPKPTFTYASTTALAPAAAFEFVDTLAWLGAGALVDYVSGLALWTDQEAPNEQLSLTI